MGHLVNPFSFRLGESRTWRLKTFYNTHRYLSRILNLEDYSIRAFFERLFNLRYFMKLGILLSDVNILHFVNCLHIQIGIIRLKFIRNFRFFISLIKILGDRCFGLKPVAHNVRFASKKSHILKKKQKNVKPFKALTTYQRKQKVKIYREIQEKKKQKKGKRQKISFFFNALPQIFSQRTKVHKPMSALALKKKLQNLKHVVMHQNTNFKRATKPCSTGLKAHKLEQKRLNSLEFFIRFSLNNNLQLTFQRRFRFFIIRLLFVVSFSLFKYFTYLRCLLVGNVYPILFKVDGLHSISTFKFPYLHFFIVYSYFLLLRSRFLFLFLRLFRSYFKYKRIFYKRSTFLLCYNRGFLYKKKKKSKIPGFKTSIVLFLLPKFFRRSQNIVAIKNSEVRQRVNFRSKKQFARYSVDKIRVQRSYSNTKIQKCSKTAEHVFDLLNTRKKFLRNSNSVIKKYNNNAFFKKRQAPHGKRVFNILRRSAAIICGNAFNLKKKLFIFRGKILNENPCMLFALRVNNRYLRRLNKFFVKKDIASFIKKKFDQKLNNLFKFKYTNLNKKLEIANILKNYSYSLKFLKEKSSLFTKSKISSEVLSVCSSKEKSLIRLNLLNKQQHLNRFYFFKIKSILQHNNKYFFFLKKKYYALAFFKKAKLSLQTASNVQQLKFLVLKTARYSSLNLKYLLLIKRKRFASNTISHGKNRMYALKIKERTLKRRCYTQSSPFSYFSFFMNSSLKQMKMQASFSEFFSTKFMIYEKLMKKMKQLAHFKKHKMRVSQKQFENFDFDLKSELGLKFNANNRSFQFFNNFRYKPIPFIARLFDQFSKTSKRKSVSRASLFDIWVRVIGSNIKAVSFFSNFLNFKYKTSKLTAFALNKGIKLKFLFGFESLFSNLLFLRKHKIFCIYARYLFKNINTKALFDRKKNLAHIYSNLNFYQSSRQLYYHHFFLRYFQGFSALQNYGLSYRLFYYRKMKYLSWYKYSNAFGIWYTCRSIAVRNFSKFFYFCAINLLKFVRALFWKRIFTYCQLVFIKFGVSQPVRFSLYRLVRYRIRSYVLSRFILMYLLERRSVGYIMSRISRFLQKSKAIAGYKIVFAGRFTRKQRSTFEWFTAGPLKISKVMASVDSFSFFTILKFGVCGIKIMLNKHLPKYRRMRIRRSHLYSLSCLPLTSLKSALYLKQFLFFYLRTRLLKKKNLISRKKIKRLLFKKKYK